MVIAQLDNKIIIRSLLLEHSIPSTGFLFQEKAAQRNIKKLHSYAFCSDTMFVRKNIKKIKGVTLLYHEATFMQDLKEKAKETGHSTTIDAATMAKNAMVKKLLVGHFSKRYNDIDMILEETKSIFSNTQLAKDGLTIDFNTI